MSKQNHTFARFMKDVRPNAAQAYASGDAHPVLALSAHRNPATFLGPGGGVIQGAKRVNSANARGSGHFAPGGRSSLKIIQAAESGDLAFWTGLQLARVRLRGKPGMVAMKLRVTEVFRREQGAWKMIHRHADMLASRGGGKPAAGKKPKRP